MAVNVLIVDDSAMMRRMIAKTLALCGIPLGEVHEAGNGEEGLRVLEEKWVDLVLMDVNMPVMNGLQMLEKLRQRPETADTAVIVVSTDGSTARVEMMRKQGAGFVRKPFTPETLRDTILEQIGAGYDDVRGNAALQGDGPDF